MNKNEPFQHKPRKTMHLKPRNGRKLDSHEIQLAGFKKTSTTVAVKTLSGDSFSGQVAEFDRFSVTFDTNSGKRTVFKHAIESFSA